MVPDIENDSLGVVTATRFREGTLTSWLKQSLFVCDIGDDIYLSLRSSKILLKKHFPFAVSPWSPRAITYAPGILLHHTWMAAFSLYDTF